jgi:hypothetical protein
MLSAVEQQLFLANAISRDSQKISPGRVWELKEPRTQREENLEAWYQKVL